MMERLLKLKKDTGSRIFVSFVGEKIMIAIDYDKDLFEPTRSRHAISSPTP